MASGPSVSPRAVADDSDPTPQPSNVVDGQEQSGSGMNDEVLTQPSDEAGEYHASRVPPDVV